MTESLADRVKRLREQTSKTVNDQKIAAKYSRSERVRQDIATSGRFTYQVGQGLLWIRRWIIVPVADWLVTIIRAVIHFYHRRIWAWIVYRRTEDGVLLFSKTRAGLLLLGTGIFCWYLILPVAEFFFDAALYATTAQTNEQIYLLGSQELNSTENTHNVEGCSELPCTSDDAVYFRAQNSLFNHFWSLTHGHGVFFAEYVGAAVPYSTSLCTITSYGVRFKVTSRFLNIYPYILSVSCAGEIKPKNHAEVLPFLLEGGLQGREKNR